MRITELLTAETIQLNAAADTKEGMIQELANQLDQAGKLSDRETFVEAIFARENQSSTGMGEGVAIPHAKTSAVKTPAIAFARSTEGIDFQSLDGEPVHYFFMIAAAEGANEDHLQALSRLSTLLMDPEFRQGLTEAQNADDVLRIVEQKEKEKLDEADVTPQQTKGDQGPRRKLVAVTGCPTGIAHTHMAADALKDKARELGIDMKVQTNGSDGVKNRLTAEDIQEAEAVIIAADTKVDMAGFQGKPVLQKGVTDGMRRPGDLIEAALNGDAPIYEGTGEAQKAGEDAEETGGMRAVGQGFYKHLMNGVSHMLPFVVGGGILIALAFALDIDAEGPISSALDAIGGGHAFELMVAILAGFIAMSIADRPGLAPGMIAGYMAHTGDAGFLGGILAGFLAGYVVVWLKHVFRNLPSVLDGLKTVLFYPFFSILIVGLLMHFVIIEPIAVLMANLEAMLGGMTGMNAALLGLILGGMMAVDMGGPINKTAYAFGIAMIDAGSFGPQAAIMAGGMVPPLGIAIATTFFRSKFTKEQRSAGVTNYVMGASFITEGAIPFAAADPGRVIPSIIVGSSIAGALVMLLNIGLQAPHGGVFVAWLVDGSFLAYMGAILAGAVVTALMLGFWKKRVN
ncbi:PTS system D-fructose-specific IIA component (F1P-forming) (Frc family) /PTS system D-fructose-specific IIB component (F1P-forming) (Frc family) /PTS system D-fructose-specific IIC component (F1P-forming) (Frc family) [Salsuginibacillus halophilus]|uniref:PTS system D-fructose-specific IIA component (F1P-forming) (Frc family) /PTS system D-fructose-specific IIB component (F1P-forming) (Frc family) /PTS system D-fructose-specific IIC component (F1P-f... n=1 Tax=Salsuginibacillus halophilus TaxID=517424 RepID=A0A2P8HR12_9BACI|nr:fructose-specific PTS transporter subunit EIIC [Salsuginibacillus halophilus]PSL48612.1 PTS system D-fructose-specific IIA component (F1P-forming) (Frc family) /PTS system D-fructose-specific IIB component (F1P-forming) (Frc family) /PTS system D-fructose-specific IIC component (F1P-forming) (Frc family) [Salsuginibacillus halophilus]